MADGWSELGAGLAGGWGDGREAFVKQMKLHGDAGEALAQARIARSRAMAHEGLPAAVAGVYQDPAQAALNAAILGASATPNLRNTGDLQRPGYLALEAERQQAMQSGDFKRMNAITSVLGDKQHEPVRVTGGVMMPSGVALGDPEFGVTPLPQTEAQIRQRDAAAGASNARAGVLNVQRDAGGWKPSSARPGKTLTEPEANAKIDWIMAQATKKAEKESPEFVEAWIQNEMVKAGIQPLPAADFSGVTGAATTVPVLGGDMAPSPAIDEESQALADAQRAIATGRITKEEARQRLLSAGLTGAAGRL